MVHFTTWPHVLPEVTLSAGDLKATRAKEVDKLFTKGGYLKKPIGLASKGWKLESLKDSTTEDPSKAFLDAKHRLGEMLVETCTSVGTFIFSRRTQCKCLEL